MYFWLEVSLVFSVEGIKIKSFQKKNTQGKYLPTYLPTYIHTYMHKYIFFKAAALLGLYNIRTLCIPSCMTSDHGKNTHFRKTCSCSNYGND
jgi:hypothetical protein